jgi:hypothetical protein
MVPFSFVVTLVFTLYSKRSFRLMRGFARLKRFMVGDFFFMSRPFVHCVFPIPIVD